MVLVTILHKINNKITGVFWVLMKTNYMKARILFGDAMLLGLQDRMNSLPDLYGVVVSSGLKGSRRPTSKEGRKEARIRNGSS